MTKLTLTNTTDVVEGVLSVTQIFSDGRSLEVFKEPNLIMLPPKQKMLGLIYLGTPVTIDPINSLHIGIGGCIDPNGMFPKTPNQNLTNLYSPLLSIPTSFTADNSVPSVTFISDMDQGTGNGNLITEAGLFTNSGSMFNIKTFPAIPKTSEFSLHFEWTIKLA